MKENEQILEGDMHYTIHRNKKGKRASVLVHVQKQYLHEFKMQDNFQKNYATNNPICLKQTHMHAKDH